jgi:uncharacterized membrane protein YeaQ/YmgE (transglycosylase-associated protein family)
MSRMVRQLGFINIPSEAVFWFVGLVIVLSLVIAWVVDDIMHEFAFGVIGNTLLLVAGSIGGLALWNQYGMPVKQTDPMVIGAVCIGSAFGLVLALAITRRVVT